MAAGSTKASADEKLIPALVNAGYFSDYYLGYRLDAGLADLYARWDAAEKQGDPTPRTRVRSLSNAFDKYRADAAATAPPDETDQGDEGDGGAARAADQRHRPPAEALDAQRDLNAAVLEALGWAPERRVVELTSGHLTVSVPVVHECATHSGRLLLAVETGFATDPASVVASRSAAGALLDPVLVNGVEQARSVMDVAQIVFIADDPPSYLLVVSGGSITLLDRDRWAEGVFIGADLDDAVARHDTRPKGELAAIAALFSAAAINPGDDAQSVLTGLLEKATSESAGVSKELRHGMRRSVELLANAVVSDMRARQKVGWRSTDPKDLTRQCLRYLYRVIVLLFAESRPELGILPADDPDYQAGYSLARLRDTALVDLQSDQARNGNHLQQSLAVLFELVNQGHESAATLDEHDSRDLAFPGLRSSLFSDAACPLVDKARLPDHVLQQVLANLCFTREKAGARRQTVSYATLGINQLGAVYEGLMAYSGFLATEELYEIDKDGDPDNGSWVIPVDRADEFPDEVFLTEEAPDGSMRRVRYQDGDFVFRLSGRDRQRSASYYTPEVLTEFTVRHALDVLFEENPGLTSPDLLKLTVCEPALGSGAFANEAVNQLAARYLKLAQDEQSELPDGRTIDPDQYQLELQKVKAHFAVNQVFGVDLNQTAVELAEVSLWLNCMHPGLQAPWFGARLRRGNSLIGARRATYSADQVKQTAHTGNHAVAPTDQPLGTVPLGQAPGIHHFLLPGEGWGAPAGAREIRELAPDWVQAVRAWQRAIAKKPNDRQLARLQHLASRVEDLWSQSAEEVAQFWEATRQHIDVWGAETPPVGKRFGDEAVRRVLHDPRSATFRLRAVMNAWCSLWMWAPQHGTDLPSLEQWLSGLEALLKVEDRPLDPDVLFNDERELDLRVQEMTSVDEALAAHPWLATCQQIADQQAWFHWELEFSPVFQQGGFDLQVGNPPWVRPTWDEPSSLAEHDPWWGVTDLTKTRDSIKKARRLAGLESSTALRAVSVDRAEIESLAAMLGSGTREPALRGVQTNLYMVFMTNTWRRSSEDGAVGLVHPESHFVDPKAGALRASAYRRLRRHWQFVNEGKLFEDVHNETEFGVHVYGRDGHPAFVQAVSLHTPSTVDRSLVHDGAGEVPGVQHVGGGWDVRPHRERLVEIDEAVLTDWVLLFDPPGTPASKSRLLRPLTRADLAALSVFAHQPARLADTERYWTRAFDEDKFKKEGTGEWRTEVPDRLDECVLQGPHLVNATPFAQQPRPECKNNKDWEALDLETLPADFIPRTNYQRRVDHAEFVRRQPKWDGEPFTTRYREAHREFVPTTGVRTLQSCLLPPGPAHVHAVISIALPSDRETAIWAATTHSLPLDYLLRVAGNGHLSANVFDRIPKPSGSAPIEEALLLRTLRLNCVSTAYGPLWRTLHADEWSDDQFSNGVGRAELGDVSRTWTSETPLRKDADRWQALCEIDALVALLLGLSAAQLTQMYRSQFAVLRKYEYVTVFDGNGRQISGIHHNHGFRQAQWEEEQKAAPAQRGQKKMGMWDRVQAYLAGDTDVDLGPFVPPFTPADRELAMTTAYWAFVDRYDLSPPDLAERPA